MSSAAKVDPTVNLNAEFKKAGIPIKLDRERRFLLNIKGFRLATQKLEKERGEKVNVLKLVNWSDFGLADISLLLWVGLLSDDPELTQDQSDEIADLFGLLRSKDMILESLANSFPEVEENLKKLMRKSPATVELTETEAMTEQKI